MVFGISIWLGGFLKTILLFFVIGGTILILINKDKVVKGVSRMKFLRIFKRKHKDKKKRKIWGILGILVLLAFIASLLAGAGFIAYIVATAPEFDPENLYRKESSVIYDSEGKVLAKIGREIRQKITYDQIPQVFIDALIATEDSRYFQHNGFDLPRFAKATIGQAMGQNAGGASTLSMQVVKNNFTSTKQSIVRKFKDIYLAIFKLERKYSKEEIIEFYVNAPYLGNSSYGIAEAARNYFNKDIKDINLSEAAMLAGLFQAPGAYDPYVNPESTAIRRSTVLNLMLKHGYISQEEADLAKSIPIEKLIKKYEGASNPYQGYIDAVIDEVTKKTENSPYDVPMKIYTNMNRGKQDLINNVMAGQGYTWENEYVQAGIALVDVQTGAVVAIGNGHNRSGERLFNFATMLKRQIGSTAKSLFDYGPGMEYNNASTYTPFLDDEYGYTGGKAIKNWDNKYQGLITSRVALAQSRNIPALKAFQQVENKKIIEFVTNLGIKPDVEDGWLHEAHSIGAFSGASPVEMAGAYAAFANGGYYTEPHFVNKIEYIENNDTTLFKYEKTQVMSDSTAYMITDILRSGVRSGYLIGGRVRGVEMASKTGTTNFDEATRKKWNIPASASNDLWLMSYSPEYAMGFWYGYEKITPGYYNGSAANTKRSQLYNAIAPTLFGNATKKTFTTPSSVVSVEIEKDSIPALLPSEYTPLDMRLTEVFKKGTEPTMVSTRFAKLPNVTELDGTETANGITLSWNPVAVSDTITEEYKTTLGTFVDKYLAIRQAYNTNVFGTLGYNVYRQNNDGSLTLLDFTTNTEYTDSNPSSGTTKYVVKTTYTIFKSNMSSGAEITLSSSNVSVVDVSLVGAENITLNVGDSYTDQGVKVLVDLVNKTSDATITKTITNSAGSTVSSVSTSTIDTYTIKYKVIYKNETYNLTRTVVVS